MKIIFHILVALVFAGVSRGLELEKMFQRWKLAHGKSYVSEIEEISRFSIWLDSFTAVKRHNQLYERDRSSYYIGLNAFSDLTDDEFTSIYASNYFLFMDKLRPVRTPHRLESIGEEGLPVSVNWTAAGWVSSVDNQLQCGSCYAFAGSAALEAQLMNATGKLIKLSKQQIVDCSNQSGCNGGYTDEVWEYLYGVAGLMSEKDYPYKGKQGKCRYEERKAVAWVSSYSSYLPDDENLLKKVVARVGPIECIIDASCLADYAGGIFDSNSPHCSDTLNHAIVITGYGVDSKKNLPYWIIKNSWGQGWGLQGYLLVVRGKKMLQLSYCNFPLSDRD